MIDRLAGYRAAMAAADLPEVVLAGGFQDASLDDRCHGLLRRNDRPTALVLYHASMAPSFLVAAARLGLAVPRDLSLITFSDRQDVFGGIRLDGVRGSYAAMGAAAVAMLRDAIARPGDRRQALAIPGEWYTGNTFGPA
jgi:DNA-binding LacI/PurR family transcriptional regulator